VRRKRNQLRGLAQPGLVRQPILVRACDALVDNLALIRRTALIFGAVLFIGELRESGRDAGDFLASVSGPPAGRWLG